MSLMFTWGGKMLKAENLSLHYGSSKILHGVSISSFEGQISCLMGSNGVGKTSLLRLLSGTHKSTSGTYQLNKQNVTNFKAERLAKMGVGYVPQGRMIFPLLSVRENLETGYACLKKEDRLIPEDIYNLFPILKTMENRRGGDLSGGQQQQLAIARALIIKPRLLLLDEPTEGIQPNIISHIGEVIQHLKAQNSMAILLVEQFFEFAFKMADYFYVMKRGQIVFEEAKATINKAKIRSALEI